MEQFKNNTNYYHKHITDSSLTTQIEIIKRTAKTIFFINPDTKEEKKAKIHNKEGKEFFYPYGRYSMCPIVRSSNIA